MQAVCGGWLSLSCNVLIRAMMNQASPLQFSSRSLLILTAIVAVVAAVPVILNRLYYLEHYSVIEFMDQYEDICEYELSIWDDDFTRKIMGVYITSKLEPEHRCQITRIHGTSIGEEHFYLTRIGGYVLSCYQGNNHGKRIARRRGIDIGQNGAFRELLEIDSLASLIHRHEEIVEVIEGWPGQNDEHRTMTFSDGRLRYYAYRENRTRQ